MNDLYYFAYGSNMLSARLQYRVPSARFDSVARLDGYSLFFCKNGEDGSGKCNLMVSDGPDDHVYGVIYRLAAVEKSVLDRIEGPRYEVTELQLSTAQGKRTVFAYQAGSEHMEPGLQPYEWYKAFVVEGARAHGLPRDYIAFLDGVVARSDPDTERALFNASILGQPYS